MQPDALQRAWVAQAQQDAERGVIACRVCKAHTGLDASMTVWRNGLLVFAICDRCTTQHSITMTPTEHGIEVRAQRELPLIIGGAR
jgi:hypothetical protein